MSNGPFQATPREELRYQIMSSIVPKNEREWWANRTINDLERRISELQDKYDAALDDIIADSKENSESNAIIRELQLKIKRLEEAGDATANLLLKGDLNDHTALMHTYSMWTKAKEAKL